MDKSQIPTKSYTFGKDDYVKEVSLYEWITHDEEDQYQSILYGRVGVDQETAETKKVDITITIDQVNEAERHLISSYISGLSMEEFNVLHPSVREGIREKAKELHDKKK